MEKTEEELAKEFQELQKKKVDEFVSEYNELVKKHGVQLVGVAIITPEGVRTELDIRIV